MSEWVYDRFIQKGAKLGYQANKVIRLLKKKGYFSEQQSSTIAKNIQPMWRYVIVAKLDFQKSSKKVGLWFCIGWIFRKNKKKVRLFLYMKILYYKYNYSPRRQVLVIHIMV